MREINEFVKKWAKVEEMDSNIFSKFFQDIKAKEKYDFSHFEVGISTLCKRCV